MAVVRGCGTRQKGGIYVECPLSPYGKPLEEFLVDPPIPVDVKALGITQVGVKLVERGGVWHIMDWVGSGHYENVADFVEEVRRFGLSRRLSKSLDFKKLSPQSRIILLHSRAFIENFKEYYKAEEGDVKGCPKDISAHQHEEQEECCARLWWQDITGGECDSFLPDETPTRSVKRTMPSFEYNGLSKPEDVEPDYKVAIFASFPVTNIAVVRDPQEETHKAAIDLLSGSRLPVELVDE